MLNCLKHLFTRIVQIDNEKGKICQYVQHYAHKADIIIDVGCGYGRLLAPLKALGYNMVGIEKNPIIIKTNQLNGYECWDDEAFAATNQKAKVIILAHIIEHFTPADLMTFLNNCLDKLETGGYLIIATPLYSQYFYDDFDHVKPYHPVGLQMVFGGKDAQVQYYSPHTLALKDLWFRRSAFFNTLRKSTYIKTPFTRLHQLLDFTMAVLYRLSFGFIGAQRRLGRGISEMLILFLIILFSLGCYKPRDSFSARTSMCPTTNTSMCRRRYK